MSKREPQTLDTRVHCMSEEAWTRILEWLLQPYESYRLQPEDLLKRGGDRKITGVLSRMLVEQDSITAEVFRLRLSLFLKVRQSYLERGGCYPVRFFSLFVLDFLREGGVAIEPASKVAAAFRSRVVGSGEVEEGSGSITIPKLKVGHLGDRPYRDVQLTVLRKGLQVLAKIAMNGVVR